MADSPQLPADPATGTIDITNLSAFMKSTFIDVASAAASTAIKGVPYLSWLALPVISNLFDFVLKKIVTVIADGIEMEEFFLNTAVRKASQAADYVDAVNAKNKLPPTASQDEYEKAEQAEMAAFSRFVRISN